MAGLVRQDASITIFVPSWKAEILVFSRIVNGMLMETCPQNFAAKQGASISRQHSVPYATLTHTWCCAHKHVGMLEMHDQQQHTAMRHSSQTSNHRYMRPQKTPSDSMEDTAARAYPCTMIQATCTAVPFTAIRHRQHAGHTC